MTAAALYLIPVPISDAALERTLPAYNHEIVHSLRHFIVENIRSARRFLKKVDASIDIDALHFFELNEHTDRRSVAQYIDPLRQGQSMGIISEAGCPAVADPGAVVVDMAQRQDIPVVPLVGPSSLLLALMASGFNGQSFAFYGYLPVKETERNAKIRFLEGRAWKERQTQLFIEAPYRNVTLFSAVLSVCRPETRLCVAAGITGDVEYIHSRTVAEWRNGPVPAIQKIPTIFLLYGG